jgi:hypothetical protein
MPISKYEDKVIDNTVKEDLESLRGKSAIVTGGLYLILLAFHQNEIV